MCGASRRAPADEAMIHPFLPGVKYAQCGNLVTGTKRFGELKKSLTGVSQKVLTSQLREMEENGLVERKAYPEVPPRVEYSLTPLGRSLQPIMDAMRVWGEQYKQQNA